MSYYGQYESNDEQSKNGTDEFSVRAAAFPLVQTALVTKIITDPNSPHWDVGTIQFRLVKQGKGSAGLDGRNDLELMYARPANSYLVTVPAINEYIYVMHGPYDVSEREDEPDRRIPINWYYTNPIKMKGDLHNNASDADWNKKYIDEGIAIGDAAAYEAAETERIEQMEERLSLGSDLHRVPLITPMMNEGDVLINGRFGQSIKLSATISQGASKTWRGNTDLEADPPYQKPITIIRNGYPEGATDKYVDNVATDPSSIWLTNGQYIPELNGLTPFSNNRSMNIGELFEHANLGSEVNQCILRSDRIMSIARREIYQWSERGISLATRGAITLDGSQVLIEAGLINLGSGAGEGRIDRDLTYAVRGENLKKVLLEIILAFSTTTVTTAAGPGTLTPPPALEDMYADVVDGQEWGLFSKKVFLE